MDERAPIEWEELRGIWEHFTVRAHKQAGKWVFHDKSQWEVRWCALPASAERVARAEALAGVAHSEGRQVADISLIDECADDQEDLVVVLWALVELALNGDLAAALLDSAVAEALASVSKPGAATGSPAA